MNNFHQPPAIYAESLTLRVKDIKTLEQFYTTKLGFEVIERTQTSLSLGVDSRVIITLQGNPSLHLKAPHRTGLYHVAILLPSREDLGAFLAHAVTIKLPLEGMANHGVSEAIYLSDPEGNGIEIYRDLDPQQWPYKGNSLAMVTDPLDYPSLLSNPKKWNGMPQGTCLGHMHLHVSNLQLSETFYTQGLGLDLIQHYGTQASFLSSAKYHHHLGLNTWNGTSIPGLTLQMTGLAFYTWVFSSKEKLNETISRLSTLKYNVIQENNRYFVEDPSQIKMELKVR